MYGIVNRRPHTDLDAVLRKLPCTDSELTYDQQMELDTLVEWGYAERVPKRFQWIRSVEYRLTDRGEDFRWQRTNLVRAPWIAA